MRGGGGKYGCNYLIHNTLRQFIPHSIIELWLNCSNDRLIANYLAVFPKDKRLIDISY
jgi:hypothetical protein